MTLPALPDSIARSAALLEAAGLAVIEPLHPIREVWHLVAHTAQHPASCWWACSPPRPTPGALGWGCPAGIIPAPAG